MLDEMSINDVKRYAMIDPTADEYKLIQMTEQAGRAISIKNLWKLWIP